MDIVSLIEKFGFTTVMVVGLGYFVYYVWITITRTIDPAIDNMKKTIIRLTDQLRLLDQDMIRLQEKLNTVLELEKNKDGKKEKGRPSKADILKRKRQKEKDFIIRLMGLIGLIFVGLILVQSLKADEIVHKFKSPSFSGIGQSSHYLTIENQEFNRKADIIAR